MDSLQCALYNKPVVSDEDTTVSLLRPQETRRLIQSAVLVVSHFSAKVDFLLLCAVRTPSG